MNTSIALQVLGIGTWAPGLPDWPALCSYLQDGTVLDNVAYPPDARVLSPAERRRAPHTVRLALEAAAQAVAMSSCDADALSSVFASAHGDAVIMDAMCTTLAQAPDQLSPTQFHNSVHNAAAGYWSMATGCRRATSAVCAGNASFGAGLLEAAVQVVHASEPVLLVAFDAPGRGPLDAMVTTRTPFACALVLAPVAGSRQAAATLHLQAAPPDDPPSLPQAGHLRQLAHEHACGHALALLENLARGGPATACLPAGDTLMLRIASEAG